MFWQETDSDEKKNHEQHVNVPQEVQSWRIALFSYNWMIIHVLWLSPILSCLLTVGWSWFIRPIGQISKWWNTIQCWLCKDPFTNSRLTLHSAQNGHMFCELKTYARMASNHMECVRQHLAISLCWYAVQNYMFLYKADRKPKEQPSVRCNAMMRRRCYTYKYSPAWKEVRLVQVC